MKLPIGKLYPRILEEKVFKYLGFKREEVVLGTNNWRRAY